MSEIRLGIICSLRELSKNFIRNKRRNIKLNTCLTLSYLSWIDREILFERMIRTREFRRFYIYRNQNIYFFYYINRIKTKEEKILFKMEKLYLKGKEFFSVNWTILKVLIDLSERKQKLWKYRRSNCIVLDILLSLLFTWERRPPLLLSCLRAFCILIL